MTDFRLNPDLDLQAAAKTFAKDKIISIKNFLHPEDAERLHATLINEVEWELVWNEGEIINTRSVRELRQQPPNVQQELYAKVLKGASEGFQYIHFWRPILTDIKAGRKLPDLLGRYVKFVNSATWLGAIRTITENNDCVGTTTQATWFHNNHFLTSHDDSKPGTDRLYAQVYNLTKNWRADFGGVLNFFDDDMTIVKGLTPDFNCLNLFEVPHGHAVSPVTPFASGRRLAMTGWVLNARVPLDMLPA